MVVTVHCKVIRRALLLSLSPLLLCSCANAGEQMLVQAKKESEASSIIEYSDAVKAVMERVKNLRTVEITPMKENKAGGIHDNINNAMNVLQNPTEAMANFPLDSRLQVDWVKTIKQELIEPRANITGEDEMLIMDMDILMKNTQNMPYVKFPHQQHTEWLDCSNCHPDIFIPREHANPVDMNKVLRGQYCGVCHGKVSFSMFVCERCHSVPHEGSGPAWWKEKN